MLTHSDGGTGGSIPKEEEEELSNCVLPLNCTMSP